MGRKKIRDQYTDLPVSRQRKHQLRNAKTAVIRVSPYGSSSSEEYQKSYYQANRERILKRSRKHYETHKEQTKRSTHLWQEKNPDKIAMYRKRSKEYMRECRNQLMIILDLYDL